MVDEFFALKMAVFLLDSRIEYIGITFGFQKIVSMKIYN